MAHWVKNSWALNKEGMGLTTIWWLWSIIIGRPSDGVSVSLMSACFLWDRCLYHQNPT